MVRNVESLISSMSPNGESLRKNRRVGGCRVRKKLSFFLQKHAPARSFYGSSLPPTPLDPDTWVQRDGYGGSNVSENFF